MKSIGMLGVIGLGYALGSPGVTPNMPKTMGAPLAAFHADINRAIEEFSGHKARAVAVAHAAQQNAIHGLSQAKSTKDLEAARQQSVEMLQTKAAAALVILPR